jgi:SSS family solute:Na+ symporter
MNIVFFTILLFSLQLLYWAIGKRASKNLKNKEDYYLAGKTVRFFPLMMTFLATQVGGGLILGAADEAYQFGWPVLFYPLGAALGLIALGLGLGKKLFQFQASTVVEIFEIVYRSSFLRKVASLFSVISLFMILVAQIIASRKFLIATGLSSHLLFVAFWAVIILYTVRGGLKAVISTDIVQAAFFSFVFLFCFVYVVSDASFISTFEPFAAVSFKLSGWLLLPLLFMVIEQDMGQRCFAGDSAKTVSRAAFWAGVGTLLICVVPVFLGVLAKNMGLVIPEGASVLMVVISALTNPWIAALVGCAVLAAIISTATSLINAMSSNLTSDFFKTKDSLTFMQIVTSFFSIGAIFFAFYFSSIVDVLIQSYELSISALFVPIFIALFKKQGNFISAFLSMLLGTMGFCFFKLFPLSFPSEIASLTLSFLGFYAGETTVWMRKKRSIASANL